MQVKNADTDVYRYQMQVLMHAWCWVAGSLVRPKVVKSVHYCPGTGAFTNREYRDITSSNGLPTGSVYPTRVSNSLWVYHAM
jgi:hypothetical protein